MSQPVFSAVALALATVSSVCAGAVGCARHEDVPAPTPHTPAASVGGARAVPSAFVQVAALPAKTNPSLACLARLYGVTVTPDGAGLQTPLPTGAVIPWDDGRRKTEEERLETPDLHDLFLAPYPSHAMPDGNGGPTSTGDPGRIRVYALLDARYGAPGPALEKKLVTVPFVDTRVRVHPLVAPVLTAVENRLKLAIAKDQKLLKFLHNLGGTYNDRAIAGTDRKSAHAYGIAIDLSVPESAYWRSTPRFSNRFPKEIIDAFESEGFIWGGRWAHFDTMHFEYRPEFFDESCTPSSRTDPH